MVEETPEQHPEDIGSEEEIQKARKQVSDIEEQNDEAILGVIAIVRNKLLQEKMILDSLTSSSGHIIPRFLVTQAVATMGVAERLLTAALEFGVPEGAETPKAPIIDGTTTNSPEEPGTGQYL